MTLLIDQSQTSLPLTNQRPVMTTNHRPSTELTTRIVVSQYRTFLVNTSNLKGGKQKVKGGAHPNQLCKSSWYVETYETYEIDPTWPEIGRHDPKLARHDPKLARHDPKSVRHDPNIHQLLNLTRSICVVTSLTFRSQMSQIFNRQHSIFCYPSFVNRKSFKMTSRSIWLDAYFNV